MTATTFAWTDREVREALGLAPAPGTHDVRYAGVTTDSRTAGPGELYVALVGERFDGHDFVADAVGAGVRGVVASHAVAGEGEAVVYDVDDTLVALGRLATHRRRALTAPVVGITGSSGKTSTKELMRAALAGTHRVHATPANLNNRVGLPLTLLATPPDAEFVVLELGTNEPGEIGTLTAIARPDLAVIVTVGPSHLEKLGSVEGVLDEKLALLRGLAPRGRAVVGDRPPVLARQARALVPDVRVAGWGDDADPDLRPTRVEIDAWGRHTFTWRGQRVRLAVAGRHAVQNALIALAAAEMLGVEPVSAVAGLATVQSGALRDEVRAVGDLTLVIDCYNANPQSVAAALDLLEARAIGSGRVALLGSMLELGEAGPELHRAVLADALTRDLDVVVATGAFAAAASHLAPPADAPALIAVSDQNQAYERLRDRLTGNEVVLLKGSRGVALERLVPRFVADFGGGEGGG